MKNNAIAILLFVPFIFAGCSSSAPKHVRRTIESQDTQSESSIAATIAASVLSDKVTGKKVAVSDFTDIVGNEIEEGKLLAEELTTKLSLNPSITVVERKQLEKILAEQKLEMSGVTDEDSRKIGQLLNVDAVLSGTIAHLDNFEEINARLIDVRTGEILGAATTKGPYASKKYRPENMDINDSYNPMPGTGQTALGYRKELVQLREEKPSLYRRAVLAIRETENLKNNRPGFFLLLTEPENSPRFEIFAKRNPQLFQRVMNLRQELSAIYQVLPSYKAALEIERSNTLKRIKKNQNDGE